MNRGGLCRGFLWVIVALIGAGATAMDGAEERETRTEPKQAIAPAWSAGAVWYQIFVSRFCNGNRDNDPPQTLPWTHDWARRMPGEQPPLRRSLFFRRYGGDLQGVQSRLPYLRELGANTLCLSPVFRAESEHKYDTADHRHVDDSYGVRHGYRQTEGETEDPATWRWSDSDRVLLDFLAEAHRQGFRVVLDGVFNHVGLEFWAWRDVQRRGRSSRYAEWFEVTNWGPPLQWQAWDGPNGRLPNFKKIGDGLAPEVEAYLFAVARRWMDPDGDGDPSDGIDGWRLDAADRVPHGFWKRFRRVAKAMNSDAILLGEIWTDAADWLNGDEFDAVTNYRFAAPVMRFFGQEGRHHRASALMEELHGLRNDHPWNMTLAMMNLLGTHDTERAVTMLIDPRVPRAARPPVANGGQAASGTTAVRGAAAEREGNKIPLRDTLRPDEDAYRRLKLAAVFQFTYPGAPLIYYGDEAGMYGGDDPFCRAPMWWPEANAPGYRADVLETYCSLCDLRRDRIEFRRGRYRLILADDARRLLAFSRRYQQHESVVLLNCDTRAHEVALVIGRPGQSMECVALPGLRVLATFPWRADGRVKVTCPALSARLLWPYHERPEAAAPRNRGAPNPDKQLTPERRFGYDVNE